jgi:hypothetical protein
MNAIIVLLIIDTIIQLITCHFTLWWLISFVCRLLFCCRIVGATFKVKKLAIGELVAFGCMLLFNMLFAKNGIPWIRLILTLLFSAIAVGLEYLDDLMYVYVIEDEDDE